MSDNTCMVHVDPKVIVECAKKEKLILLLVDMLEPVLCSECNERFPDTKLSTSSKGGFKRDSLTPTPLTAATCTQKIVKWPQIEVAK